MHTFLHFVASLQNRFYALALIFVFDVNMYSSSPRADGAKRLARVLIPLGYLHPGKRKH
jgi:hypothetical protein